MSYTTTRLKKKLGVTRQRLAQLRKMGVIPQPDFYVEGRAMWCDRTIDETLAAWRHLP